MTVKIRRHIEWFAFAVGCALSMALALNSYINFLSAAIVVAFLFCLFPFYEFVFVVMPRILMNWASNTIDEQDLVAFRLGREKKRMGLTNED